MFALFLSVCLAAMPDVCAERLVPSPAPLDEATCIASGADRSAAWVAAHAGARLEGWRCAPLAEAPALAVAEIAPGVFVHKGRSEDITPQNRGDIANLSFVVGEEAVAVIDAGGSRPIGEGLYAAVRQVTDLPIRYLVLTHMHPDHTLGGEVFREAGAEIIGNHRLADALARRADTYDRNFRRFLGPAVHMGLGIVPPDRGVDGAATLDLGGRILDLESHPTAHTNNDLTVFDRLTGTFWSGDLVFEEMLPVLDGELLGWIAVLERLEGRTAERLVPGHGPVPLDWPQGIMATRSYLVALRDQTRAAVKRGDSLSKAAQEIARDQRGTWRLFDEINPRNATAAFTELEWE
ncbi:quinoprotein relay system zinc metallohydrolase 2 [Polymorphum gilvum]|uniref:Beta-lactamase domain protein n=1 Tax=Polymorphum gilvum (strain LMG 25793 / CGMCC 1.9160 / SL003B-26A1) TaxID=991905 RepID=F2IXV9_POLGS|nr:quinoprotein relay system zinc metallohydrolase 2 [Polymorphum gilvum]ADZ69440.1 Beta-lactamase domain protein [Polymorphum gilvum SL003B-26A1]